MIDISKTCAMKRYHGIACQDCGTYGCNECPYFKTLNDKSLIIESQQKLQGLLAEKAFDLKPPTMIGNEPTPDSKVIGFTPER